MRGVHHVGCGRTQDGARRYFVASSRPAGDRARPRRCGHADYAPPSMAIPAPIGRGVASQHGLERQPHRALPKLTVLQRPLAVSFEKTRGFGASVPADARRVAVMSHLRVTTRGRGGTHPTRAGVAQLVERNLPKVDVEGSNPFARSTKSRARSNLRRRPRRLPRRKRTRVAVMSHPRAPERARSAREMLDFLGVFEGSLRSAAGGG